MHRIPVLLAGLCLVSNPSYAQGLDEILSRNNEALGGADRWAEIDNIRVELNIEEPGFTVTGTYVASRAGQMRIDIEAGGQRVFAEGLDNGRSWQWNPEQGVQGTGDAAATALRNGIDSPGRFYTLEQARALGAVIELLEPTTGTEHRLQVTLANGTTGETFIDRRTFLTTRGVSRRAFHPDVDPTEVSVQSRYLEYRAVDGVQRPHRIEEHNLDADEWLGTTTVLSVEHDIELAEEFFRAR